MNAAVSVMVEPACLLALATYLETCKSASSPRQAAASAITEWLARQPDNSASRLIPAMTAGAEPRGYRWKCLFLPEMTQIRMVYRGRTYHAQVFGDDIVYDGQRVSPRQMTLMIAGDGRNAWRDLLIRYPGERTWSHGAARRNALARQLSPPPATPAGQATQATQATQANAEATGAAAATMMQVLQAALALLERLGHLPATSDDIVERRTERRRRSSDLMEDAFRND